MHFTLRGLLVQSENFTEHTNNQVYVDGTACTISMRNTSAAPIFIRHEKSVGSSRCYLAPDAPLHLRVILPKDKAQEKLKRYLKAREAYESAYALLLRLLSQEKSASERKLSAAQNDVEQKEVTLRILRATVCEIVVADQSLFLMPQ